MQVLNILEFMSEWGLNLVYAYATVFEMFSYTLNIFGSDYSVFTLIFTGAGLSTFLIVTVAKWIIGIIT